MNWQWLIDNGLISGNAALYENGSLEAWEYGNAIKVAYQNATDPELRRQLVDMMWETGQFEGSKEYWYEHRLDEVGDLETAGTNLAPQMGTGDEDAPPRFGIPGGAELWRNSDTGEVYIVYMVPGTEDDPVYMRWLVPNPEDVQSFFGPGQPVVYDRQMGKNDPLWVETTMFGTTDELPPGSENPFAAWASTLEIEAASQPWLLDDDYQKLLAMAMVEGRDLTEAEIASTNWYKDHSSAQRSWMLTYHQDPSTAEDLIRDGRVTARDVLQRMGVSEPDEALVNYMADQVTKGNWSNTYFTQQVQYLSDPYFAGQAIDQGLQDFMEDSGISVDVTSDMENEVRSIVQRWLGTNFGNWDDATIKEWAGRLRNETDGAEALTEILKDQRQALFPQYDREADYETIASPWRNMIRNLWGTVPNDSDMLLHDVIRLNDATEAGKLLTREGLNRGNKLVAGNVQQAINQSIGGTLR